MDEYIKRKDVCEFIRTAECDKCGFVDECVFCTVNEMLHAIELIPAADVEEVRHGEWIPASTYDTREHFYRCSACNRYESVMYEYCHCGARMDGKGEDNDR